MRQMRRLLLAVSTVALLAAPGAQAATRNPDANIVAGSYIVVYKASVSSAGVAAATDRREAALGFQHRHLYARAIRGFSAELSPSQVQALRQDPDVDLVSPNHRVQASAIVPLAPGEPVPPTGVRRILAATTTTVRQASGVNVAVIDTGIDLDHPDLNVANGTNCITPGSPAEDGNGHGTHVAGTIGAKNNGSGVTGVAPGTKVYAVKVLDDSGSGTWASVICGIDWVSAYRTALNIRVANMSLGGGGAPVQPCSSTVDPVHLAICNSTAAGVNYVVAAGNDGWEFDYPDAPNVPAAYPEALTVGAVSDSDGQSGAAGGGPACRFGEGDDAAASFSNYALTDAGKAHTIASPGVCIRSTWMGGGYNTISGTSMASPHIAGLVALCINENGINGACAAMTAAQVITHMRADASTYNTANAGYGFTGDPLRPPPGGGYFGFLASIPVPTAGNLVANPSFETDLAGWGSWQGSLSRVAINGAPDGGWVARATRTTGNNYSVGDNEGTTPTVPSVTAGVKYLASCHVRAANAQTSGRPGRIVLRERVGAFGTTVKETFTPFTLGSTFKRVSVAAVAVATGNMLGLRCEQLSATPGDAFDADSMTVTVASTSGEHTLSLARSGSGTGAISSQPTGIDCGVTCSANFSSATPVTLTAVPASGSTFAGWSGACTGTAPTCTVSMSADATVTAAFAASGGDNLVANPSFETSLAGWGSWQGSLSRVAVSGAPDGGWVARATRTAGNNYSVGDNEGVAPTVPSVTAGSTYVASCYVRAASAQASGRPGRIVLRERVGAFGATVRETATAFTFSTTFQRVSVTAVAVTTGNMMGLRCEQTSAVAGDAFDADLMTVALETNLVANSSFETDVSGWGSWQGSLSRVAVSGAPNGGWVARATRLTGNNYSVGDNEGKAPTVTSVTAGSTYVAGCSVRAASAQTSGRPGRIVLRERVGAFGATVKETATSFTFSTTFKRVSVAAVAVTTANMMGLRCEQTSAVAGDAFDADLMTVARATTVGGNTTAGTLWTTGAVNVKRASAMTLSTPREIVSLQAYLDGKAGPTGSQPVSGVLYAGTTSGPTTRVATTSAVTISAGQAAGWVKLSFATPVRVAAGTYWIGLHTGGSSAVLRFAAQTVSGALRSNGDSYGDGATATFGSATTEAKSLSLYAAGSWTP